MPIDEILLETNARDEENPQPTFRNRSHGQKQASQSKLQHPSCDLISKRHHASYLTKRRWIKRSGTVVSPFSECRKDKDNEINAICPVMPLQTTGGYFKGKPPIRHSTPLGCFRMQSTVIERFRAAPPSESSNKFSRCYTADVSSSSKNFNLVRRPGSHCPCPKESRNLETQQGLHLLAPNESFHSDSDDISYYSDGNNLPFIKPDLKKHQKTFQVSLFLYFKCLKVCFFNSGLSVSNR